MSSINDIVTYDRDGNKKIISIDSPEHPSHPDYPQHLIDAIETFDCSREDKNRLQNIIGTMTNIKTMLHVCSFDNMLGQRSRVGQLDYLPEQERKLDRQLITQKINKEKTLKDIEKDRKDRKGKVLEKKISEVD
jgi:hypothetical protein